MESLSVVSEARVSKLHTPVYPALSIWRPKPTIFLFVSAFTRQRPESPSLIVDTMSYSVVYPTVWYS
jgi:hypothetical protein